MSSIPMRYAGPMLLLGATTAAFFLAARGQFQRTGGWGTALRVVVALPLWVSGSVHLARPEILVPMIPPGFPDPRLLVLVSGACELAGATGLFVARTQRTAAVCLALLMIAIFPANVYVAGETIGGLRMPEVPARTAMQMGYIALLLVAGWGWPRPGAGKGSRERE